MELFLLNLLEENSEMNNPYWTSRKNSLELIELSNVTKVSVVWVSSRISTKNTSKRI